MKVFKRLFCKHVDLKWLYTKNLSNENCTTTLDLRVCECMRCGKIIKHFD